MVVEHPVRFGAFVREITVGQRYLSANALVPSLDSDAERRAYRRAKLSLRSLDVYRLLQPYASARLRDQAGAVIPLAVYLVCFKLLILRQGVDDSWTITGGLAAVIIGLMLFMEGLKIGLMPFGESLGNILPSKAALPVVLLVTFLLGIGVTFAEPAIGALQTAGASVDVRQTPSLFALLNDWSDRLVLVVGIGVGFAAVIGTLRFIYGWSLKPLIYATLTPLLGLTIYVARDPEMRHVIGLAWDCGAAVPHCRVLASATDVPA
ncbi:MAG: DUF1538 family protein [Gammaproteobacteria bacterium]|jgi:hypothetical protein